MPGPAYDQAVLGANGWECDPTPNVNFALDAPSQALVEDKSASIARVCAAYYPFSEGSGTTLVDSGADGPDISVGGTTTGIWVNSGWLTHDAAGNTLNIANNPYIDGLLDMTTDGSILIGVDMYATAWPTATETLWAIHRSDLSGGGVRMPLTTSAGRISVYYKPGGGSDTEQAAINMSGGYLGTKISILTELRIASAEGKLKIFLYVNGKMERANTITLGTPPATNSAGGLYFSGYGAGQKLGTSGAGTPGNNIRTKNCYVMRHSGKNRNIAGRLARYVSDNGALPSWLTRV